MSWQDIILSAGGMVFVLAVLTLAVSKRTRVNRTASLTTSATLAAFVVAYGSLGLWGAAATTALTSGLWAFVGWRRAGA